MIYKYRMEIMSKEYITMVAKYLKNVGAKRIIYMIVGNIILSVGVAAFKLSGMGNDPFSGMVMALAELLGMAYANFLVIVNLILFVFQVLWGRKLIGAGTVMNALLNGYIMTFFYNQSVALFGKPESFWQQFVILLLAVIICGLGLSLYQTADVGVAPYDSLSLMMSNRWKKIDYFWHRITTDAICALACWLAGGIVGLGTLVCAFGLGYVIHFFNKCLAEKLMPEMKQK